MSEGSDVRALNYPAIGVMVSTPASAGGVGSKPTMHLFFFGGQYMYTEHQFNNELYHHGIKGQKWGVRRFQNDDGSLTPAGRKRYTVFVSGSSKTEDRHSGYYRRRLPKEVRKELKSHIKNGDKIIVGDAPGVDRQVQRYLKKKHYKDVEVYGPGDNNKVRYSANKKWKQTTINSGKYKPDTDEWRAEKDIFMSKIADKGLAVVLENGGAGATRNNVKRLLDANKDVKVYELRSNMKKDNWVKGPEDFDPYKAMDKIDKSLSKKERNLLGVDSNTANVPVEKFFFNKEKSAYLIATDYHGKYKDEHPVDGKILGIAAQKNARGTGATDKLLSDAKKHYKNDRLVAEIDKENIASRKLFERNGFEKVKEDDYIDYYIWQNKKRFAK